ncbi:MAG: hypothetical protein AB7O96_02695 [Pseudobdellovibrionaceae bacterium]
MENLTPNRILVIALVSLGMFAMTKLTGSPTAEIEQDEVANYEMVRPKSFSKDFTLEGREIQYDINDQRRKKVPQTNATNAKPAPPVIAKPVQPAAVAAKKAQAKKKTATANPIPQANVAQNQTPTEEKKMTPPGGVNVGQGASPDAPATTAVNTTVYEPRTKEEWKEFLLKNPTSENMTRFLNAYSAKKFSKEDFYEVVGDLLEEGNDDAKMIGLRALATTTSYESYVMIVQFYQVTKGKMQAATGQLVAVYSHPSHFRILEDALKSDDPVLVVQTLSVIDHAAKKAKIVKANNNVRHDREDRGLASGFPSHLFQKFLPLLQSLTGSDDARVASSASNLIGELDKMIDPGLS